MGITNIFTPQNSHFINISHKGFEILTVIYTKDLLKNIYLPQLFNSECFGLI